MSLESLVGVALEAVTPSGETIARLLAGAERQIRDAKSAAVSSETRFASAYGAIRMLADVALHSHGYRTLTSKPGHHQTAIQSLRLTLGVDARTIVRLDALRRLRNSIEYTGDVVPAAALAECVAQAEALHATTVTWIRTHRPKLA
jgi:hypothetical protein